MPPPRGGYLAGGREFKNSQPLCEFGIMKEQFSHLNIEQLSLHNTYHNKMWLPHQMLIDQLGC